MRLYTYRITDAEGSFTESLRMQLIGDALLDARTACLLGPGGRQTIEVIRYPGAHVVLKEERRDGQRLGRPA